MGKSSQPQSSYGYSSQPYSNSSLNKQRPSYGAQPASDTSFAPQSVPKDDPVGYSPDTSPYPMPMQMQTGGASPRQMPTQMQTGGASSRPMQQMNMGGLIRALLGGGGGSSYMPGMGWTLPQRLPNYYEDPAPTGPTAPPPAQSMTGAAPQLPTTPVTPTPTDPGAVPKTPTATPTYQQPQTMEQWAAEYAKSHPQSRGSIVNLMDQNFLQPDGSWTGPAWSGWMGGNGFNGIKDNVFNIGGNSQIGMLHGWNDPNSPGYADAMKRLRAQMNVGIPNA